MPRRDDDDRDDKDKDNEPTGKELRLMLRAAREEGREEVNALLSRFGFKSVKDLESVLDAAEQAKRDKANDEGKSKAKDDEDAARAKSRSEMELRESLLDAGVKRAELDLAVVVMERKIAKMGKDDAAAYNAEKFAADFRASNPQAFRDYDPDKSYRERREAEKQAEAAAAKAKADEDAAKAKDKGADNKETTLAKTGAGDKTTTGLNGGDKTKMQDKPTFNALKASKEDYQKRLAELRQMAARSQVLATEP